MSRRMRRANNRAQLKMIHSRLEEAQKTVKPHRGVGITVTNRKLALMVNTKVFHYQPGIIYGLFVLPIGLGVAALVACMMLPLAIAYSPFWLWENTIARLTRAD